MSHQTPSLWSQLRAQPLDRYAYLFLAGPFGGFILWLYLLNAATALYFSGPEHIDVPRKEHTRQGRGYTALFFFVSYLVFGFVAFAQQLSVWAIVFWLLATVVINFLLLVLAELCRLSAEQKSKQSSPN